MHELPPTIDSPTASSKKLAGVLESILQQIEQGESVDIEALKARHPDIAPQLEQCFQNLQFIEGAAGLLESSAPAEADEKGSQQKLPFGEIGDFRIIRQLGRGGMGVVYEAEQLSLRRKVALKVLPFATLSDQRAMQRFKNEVAAVASLDHPHIVDVYAVACDKGVHHYAMRLIRGSSVAQILERIRGQDDESRWTMAVSSLRGSSPNPGMVTTQKAKAATTKAQSTNYFDAVARFGESIAEALDYAHEHGVIHRDVKPANLMIDDEGKAWITDFGLAQMATGTQLTMTGDLLGTALYMSPEQLMAKRIAVDHRTDIYSLGVTLYEMLTLTPPFKSENRQELFRQIMLDEPKPPRKHNALIPEDLETIVLKAIEKNPVERYASAQDLADDLQRFRQHEPILARRATIIQKTMKWTMRHQALTWAVMLTLLGMSIVSMVAGAMIATTNGRLTTANKELAQQTDLVARREKEALRSAASAKAINRFLTDYVLAKAEPASGTTDEGKSFRDALDNASQYADRWFPDDSQLRGALYHTIAQLYGRLGQFERSETHYRKAIEILKTPEGEGNHANLLGAMNDFGHTLTLLGKTAEADELLRRSLQDGTERFGTENPVTLTAMLNLSQVLAAQKQLEEARRLAQQCWNVRTRVLGHEHPDTALAAVGLAHVLTRMGESDAAKQLLLPAANILREQRGIEDLNTQRAVQDLAKLSAAANDLPDAESLWREILQARIRVQGSDHSLTMAAMDEMASLLEAQGRLAEAESLLTALAKTRSRRFGSGSEVNQTVSRIAKLLWKQGKLPQSAALISQSINDQNKDADSIDLAVQYADVLLALGKHAQAEQLMRESFELTKATLGEGHPRTAECLYRLLFSLQGQRKLFEARALGLQGLHSLLPNDDNANGGPEEMAMVFVLKRQPYADTVFMLQESLQHKRETLPKMHLSIATTLCVLAQNQMVNQNFAEAEGPLKECLEIRQQGLPVDNWLLAETKSLLGECLSNLGHFEQAQPLLNESYRSIADSKELLAVHKSEFAERLVKLYKQWGKPEQGQRWHEDLVRLLSECVAEWKISTTHFDNMFGPPAMNRLGESLCVLGRYQEAEAILLHSAAMQEISRWYDDPHRVEFAVDGNRQPIARLYDAWNKPDEANRWRVLSPAAANCGETELTAWYQQRITLWESVCQRQSNSIYVVRLASAYSDLALLFLRYKKWEEAVTWFEKSSEILSRISEGDADYAWAMANLTANQMSMADALAPLNRQAEALHCLELAVELAEKLNREFETSQFDLAYQVRQAPAKLAMFLANCSSAAFRDPKRSIHLAKQVKDLNEERSMRLALGVAHYRQNDFPSTINVLGDESERSGSCVLAMAHYKMGDKEAARFHYEAAIANYQRNRVANETMNSLGQWWEYDRIEQFCAEATQLLGIKEDERDSLVAYSRGMAFLQKELPSEALESFRRAIKVKPENGKPYLGLAKAILASGRDEIQAAVKAMKKYFELTPTNATADAYATLGKVAAMNGEVESAFAAVEKALELQPDFAQAYHDLGQVLVRTGSYDKASTAFAKTVEIKPDEPQLLNNFAWFLATCENVQYRDPVRAVDLANKLTQLAPKVGNAWNTLAVAQYHAGDYQNSIKSLNKAIELNHEASGCDCIFLAMAHWQLGEHELARDCYTKADAWMQRHKSNDPELQRFRMEATELLGNQVLVETKPGKH